MTGTSTRDARRAACLQRRSVSHWLTTTREASASDLMTEATMLVDAIHLPIGEKILAVTPAEIAVSIAAEMIRCRAQRRPERPHSHSAAEGQVSRQS